jgi:SAM-dependent methyltransferase
MGLNRLLYSLVRLLPRPVIETGYRFIEWVDPVSRALYGLRSAGAAPIPPMRLRARVGSRSISAFLSAGRCCAEALDRAIESATGRHLSASARVLDFGCGCGRTWKFVAPRGPAIVEGCDVDREAISWMQANAGPDLFHVNDFAPPLPYPGDRFDVVYSVSIFTHLNETQQHAWLGEIGRVLRPGGIALLTVQSGHALKMFLADVIYATASMKARLAKRDSLDRERFLFEPYDEFLTAPEHYPGIRDTYGLTFHDHDYIRSEWNRYFEVLRIDTGTVDGLQDVVVLRKRG